MFKIVPDYEFIQISREGIVKSSLTGNTLKPFVDKDGYLRVKAWDGKKLRGCYIHRAVAKAFIPNPEDKPQVNHKNSNRQDNRVENLEWVTAKENSEHGTRVGNFKKGEEHSNSVYLEEQIRDVCSLLEAGKSLVVTARLTGVDKRTVFDIKSKKTWVTISNKYNLPVTKKKLEDVTVQSICEDYLQGYTRQEILKKYSETALTRHTLRFILQKKTFKHMTEKYNWE